MKQKYIALKMYLIGLTVGLFILGWSAVARTDVAQANVGNEASTTSTISNTTIQTQSTNQQSAVTQPSIRTRTS